MMKGQTKQGTLEMKYNFAMQAHVPKVPVTKPTNWLSSSWRPDQTEYQKCMMDMDESGIGLEQSRHLAVFYRLQAEAVAVDLNKQEEKQHALDVMLDAASDEIQSTRATLHEQGLFYNGEVASHQKTRETHLRDVEKWRLQLSIFTANCIQTMQNQEAVIKELVSTQRHLETVSLPMQIADIRKEERTKLKAQQKMVGTLTRKLKKVRRQCLSQSKTLTARKRQGLQKNAQLKVLELQVRAVEKVRVKEAMEEQLKEEHHPSSGGGGIEDGLPGEDPDDHVLLRMVAKLQSDKVSLLKLRQQDEGLIQLLVQEKAEAVQLADSIMTTAENVKAKRELAHAAELALVREEAGLMSSPLAAQSDTAEELQEPTEEEEVLEVVRPGGSQCSAGWRGVKRSGVPLPVPSPHKKGKVASQEVVADYTVGETEETAAEVSKDSVAWLHTLFGRNRKTT